MISDELREAYEQTNYVVEVSRTQEITLRVGEQNSTLDQMLRARATSDWAFVTAYNPRSVSLPNEVNEARHQELLRRTRLLNYRTLPGRGEGDDASWPAEKSLFIFDITVAAARSLGREFGQHAVVVGTRGGPARLLFVESEIES